MRSYFAVRANHVIRCLGLVKRISGTRAVAMLLIGAVLAACGGGDSGGGGNDPVCIANLAGHDSSPWETATPESAAIDGAALTAAIDGIGAGQYGNIHSLLVVRHQQLLSESYFTGLDEPIGCSRTSIKFDAGTLHDGRSVTKSVVSMLLGIMLSETSFTVDTPILEILTDYADTASPDAHAVRLRDALTMSLGLQWDEGTYPYGDSRNSESSMNNSADPIAYVLGLPAVSAPGTTFTYSGGATTLLGAVIEHVTGKSIEAYAEEKLFGPLGITGYAWSKGQSGQPLFAAGLRLVPRDYAKLGAMYLNQGAWAGEQIVPANWVAESLAPHMTLSESETGIHHYGYQWWLGGSLVNGVVLPWSGALGNGGQHIALFPERDLVIVITAGMYGDGQAFTRTSEIVDRVLAAVAE